MQKLKPKNLKKEQGITLIALVVTIVVLLILAAVSLNLVLGNNGLITKSKDAKEQTEMAQIKDEAELVKSGLLVNDLTGERAINQPRLITAIQEHFEGSSLENGRIVTKDGKYDIIVKNNLDIVVVKHGEEYLNIEEIGITYTTQDVAAGVEVTLSFEIAGFELLPYQEYPEWATEVLNNLPTTEPERTEALEQMFIESNKYYIGADLPEEAKDITDFAEWMSFCETLGYFEEGDEIPTTIEAFRIYANGKYGWTYSTVEEMLIGMNYVEPEKYNEYCQQYNEQQNEVIAVEVSNGDSFEVSIQDMQATYTITQNGTYTFTATGPNGETGEITIEINSISYKIGDYVNYTYDPVADGYSLLSTQSGYSSNQTVAQSATTLKWRILNIDEENGTIDLVSAAPTDNTVYFSGSLGYNNGVYLLNDMCAALYSNSSLGITARSINLVDMEKHLTTAGFAARNAYTTSDSVQYGSTYEYTSNKYYPKLYANQLGAGIDLAEEETVTQPNINETVDPYNESNPYYSTPTTETYTNASTSLTITQTYYYIPINETNYGEAASVLRNNYFWVASRCALAYGSGYANFGLRLANTYMRGNAMFRSDYFTYRNNNNRLRPVVSLSSSLLDGTKDASGAWNLK